MERPSDLFDIDDLRNRAKAYEEHCLAEYNRAENERTRLLELHCKDQIERMNHWGEELMRIQNVRRSLSGVRRDGT